MQLVEINKSDLVTNTIAISEGVKRDHDTIIKLVDRNIEDLKEFGEVGFVIRAGYNNSKVRVAIINEQQTTLLITYMRNNDIVRAFKKKLVSEFFLMRTQLGAQKKTRDDARLEYRPMTDAIKSEREAAGKEIKPHHFSNEADLINRIALGMTSAKFRAHQELKKDASIRDYLTPEQMRCVVSLQRANTVYIESGMEFDDRKIKLRELYERNHLAKLMAEVQLLDA